MRRFAPIAAGIFPWLGGLLLLLAAGFWAHSRTWAHAQVRAEGTVTENVAAFAPGGGVLYFPRVRFRMPDGDWMQVQSRVGADDAEFAAGTAVPVLYRPGDPQGAEIATTGRVYFAAIVLGLIGTVLFDVGFFCWLLLRSRAQDDRRSAPND